MFVVNKRYYDYDYDNNTIIMFDAEDVALTLDLDDSDYLSIDNIEDTDSKSSIDNNNTNTPKQAIIKSNSKDPMTSQSTDTIPDDIEQPNSNNNNITPENNPLDSPSNTPKLKITNNSSSNSIYSNNNSPNNNSPNISWISNNSPKGCKRIPYALHIAHSYTINKLQVQLTTLVDTKKIQKQKQKQKAKQLAAAQQAYLSQQYAQQQQHYYYTQRHPHTHGPHTHARPYHYGAPPNTASRTRGHPIYPYPNTYHNKKQEITASRYGPPPIVHGLRSPPKQYITSYQK